MPTPTQQETSRTSESLFVYITSVTGASVSLAEGDVWIGDNEPFVSIGSGSVTEGDEFAEIGIWLDSPSANPVSVSYATSDGTAVSPNDFGAVSGSVTFAPGETWKSVTIPIVDDGIVESWGESFSVHITSATGASVSGSQGDVWIGDNDTGSSTMTGTTSSTGTGTGGWTFSTSGSSTGTVTGTSTSASTHSSSGVRRQLASRFSDN